MSASGVQLTVSGALVIVIVIVIVIEQPLAEPIPPWLNLKCRLLMTITSRITMTKTHQPETVSCTQELGRADVPLAFGWGAQ